MISLKRIRELSERIASEFRPERIVLFGSYARGNPTRDSDVDLLIVLPFSGSAVTKSVDIRVKCRPPFPVDLIVRTPEAIQRRIELGDPFMQDILTSGKVLYEADHA